MKKNINGKKHKKLSIGLLSVDRKCDAILANLHFLNRQIDKSKDYVESVNNLRKATLNLEKLYHKKESHEQFF